MNENLEQLDAEIESLRVRVNRYAWVAMANLVAVVVVTAIFGWEFGVALWVVYFLAIGRRYSDLVSDLTAAERVATREYRIARASHLHLVEEYKARVRVAEEIKRLYETRPEVRH